MICWCILVEDSGEGGKVVKLVFMFFFDEYGCDLMKWVCEGKFDLVIGCLEEIWCVIQILIWCIKNNLVLIGDFGVGKIVIVEGLVFVIYEQCMLFLLYGVWFISLDFSGVVVGIKYRGEFEECLCQIIEELWIVKVMVFIDELYILVGVGGVEGIFDVVNIFKLVFLCGEIQVIGVIIIGEYYCYIEKDVVFEWCFQLVIVLEFSFVEIL